MAKKKDILDTLVKIPLNNSTLGVIRLGDIIDTFAKDSLLTAVDENGRVIDCEQEDSFNYNESMWWMVNAFMSRLNEDDPDGYYEYVNKVYADSLQENTSEMDRDTLKILNRLLVRYAEENTESDFEEKIVKAVAKIVKDSQSNKYY